VSQLPHYSRQHVLSNQTGSYLPPQRRIFVACRRHNRNINQCPLHARPEVHFLNEPFLQGIHIKRLPSSTRFILQVSDVVPRSRQRKGLRGMHQANRKGSPTGDLVAEKLSIADNVHTRHTVDPTFPLQPPHESRNRAPFHDISLVKQPT